MRGARFIIIGPLVAGISHSLNRDYFAPTVLNAPMIRTVISTVLIVLINAAIMFNYLRAPVS